MFMTYSATAAAGGVTGTHCCHPHPSGPTRRNVTNDCPPAHACPAFRRVHVHEIPQRPHHNGSHGRERAALDPSGAGRMGAEGPVQEENHSDGIGGEESEPSEPTAWCTSVALLGIDVTTNPGLRGPANFLGGCRQGRRGELLLISN